MNKIIANINGIDIVAVDKDGDVYVPIKPVCEAIGIDYKTQHEKISEDDFLSPTMGIIPTVAGDCREREMCCLPLRMIYGWLATINPGKVAPEAREAVSRYRRECYEVLFEHFTSGMRKERELLEAENRLLKEREEVAKSIEYAKEESARLKKLLGETDGKLVGIRDERHNQQPVLF